MNFEELFKQIESFDWDIWNQLKNITKHQVENKECEDVFFNQPKMVDVDEKHSATEKRYKIAGMTDQGRWLLVVFTIRKEKIRIISARDQSKKEKLEFKKLIK